MSAAQMSAALPSDLRICDSHMFNVSVVVEYGQHVMINYKHYKSWPWSVVVSPQGGVEEGHAPHDGALHELCPLHRARNGYDCRQVDQGLARGADGIGESRNGEPFAKVDSSVRSRRWR